MKTEEDKPVSEYLEHFPAPFLEDLVQGRVLPFIGAGFSLNAKVPRGKKMLDWDSLGRAASGAMKGYQYTTAVDALSAYSHEFSRTKLVEFLSSSLLLGVVQPAKAHEEFCRLPFERVVTTNFDFLLEQAYSGVNTYCIPLIAEEQLAVNDPQAAVRLLKLHGDLHHPNRLVVTEEDYDSFLSAVPLLATYLASLLIGNTPLFIGYSLDDPDFRQVWQVVKDRLGDLRRPAYVLQVGAPAHVVARYERRGVKAINLPRSGSQDYSDVLIAAFVELREYWKARVIALSTSTELEPQAELSLPPKTQNRLAFFSVPTRYAALYKAHVYPIAEQFGYSPVMAAEVVAPGDSIIAKIHALIDKSALVVADVSSPNTVFEVGLVLSKEGPSKPLILIAEEQASVPFDVAAHPIIRRPASLDDNSSSFIKAIEAAFKRAFSKISAALDEEPTRLLEKKEYRAAVLAGFSLLEHELRQRLDLTGSDLPRWSLGRLLELARTRQLLTAKEATHLRAHVATRNRIAHTRAEASLHQAKTIVQMTAATVAKLRATAGEPT